jgi:hypothetical protein
MNQIIGEDDELIDKTFEVDLRVLNKDESIRVQRTLLTEESIIIQRNNVIDLSE